jgi:disease resistance protein RPM1
LETLDLRQTDANELPKEISKLGKLQHLLGNKMSLIHLKGDIGGMESLQTLSEVRIDEDGIELITELGKLKRLKKLSLFDVREGQGIALCSSINKMYHLEKLYIETKYEKEHLDLSMVSCPSLLRKLRLQAKLNKLPDWIPNLEILVELSLLYSQLTEDPLESLQNLPNLLVLNLSAYSYEGHCFHFQGGFKNLKELGLRHLSNLKSIIIEQGALDSLKELTLMNIPNLMTAPCGIDYLKNLDVLSTHFMPAEFEESIAPLAKRIKENM